MSQILNILMIVAISLVSGLLFPGCASKTTTGAVVVQTNKVQPRTTTFQAIVPYVPPSYYNCLEVSLDDLSKNYFSHYGNLDQAEQAYDGQVFVFKSIPVSAHMLVDDNTFEWGNADFIALQSGAVGQLKVGEAIDVVGIDSGPMPEVQGTPLASWFNSDGSPLVAIVPGFLYFTGCLFLPADSVQLPAPGTPAFTPLY